MNDNKAAPPRNTSRSNPTSFKLLGVSVLDEAMQLEAYSKPLERLGLAISIMSCVTSLRARFIDNRSLHDHDCMPPYAAPHTLCANAHPVYSTVNNPMSCVRPARARPSFPSYK